MCKILLLFVICFYSCSSQKESRFNPGPIAQIEFQDGFDVDTVSMRIGDVDIFNERIITSSKVHGTSDLIATFYRSNKKSKVVTSVSQSIILSHNFKDTLHVNVIVNSFSQNFAFNIEQGKYIGLNWGLNNKIVILQSKRPFRYE